MAIKKKKRLIELKTLWREYFFIGVIIISFLIVALRLVNLQIFNHSIYIALAEGQHELYEKLIPKRGEILVKDKFSTAPYPLATNRDYFLVYLVPENIPSDKKEYATKELGAILELDKQEILDKANKPNDPYEPIKHKVEESIANKVKDLNIPGVRIMPETWRFYPENDLAAQLLGFVGFSGDKKIGQYGLEKEYENILEGKEGFLELERDTAGRWISIGKRNIVSAIDGSDLVLTIDHSVQFFAEDKLKQTIEKHQADSGSVIVMDPKTGAILAMANYPSFNPNEYSKVEDIDTFINGSISKLFEPGSVFKPITMSMGLNEGKVSPFTTYVDTGFRVFNGYEIKNFDEKAYGTRTMTEVLENSLNTGAIFVEEQVGKDKFQEYIKSYEFNKPTDVDLPGEIGGNINNLNDKKRDIGYATVSFGQGISITPLRMATAIAAIANDGKMMKPYIVDKIIAKNGNETLTQPEIIKQVISPLTARRLSTMMVSVVKNGHAKKAGIAGYEIAGKTGTAQVPNEDSRGYSDKAIHSFVSFAPAGDPKFLVYMKVDNPKGVKFAEGSVVPAVSDINKFLLNYFEIPPSE